MEYRLSNMEFSLAHQRSINHRLDNLEKDVKAIVEWITKEEKARKVLKDNLIEM